MGADLWTVMRKEVLEFFSGRGSRTSWQVLLMNIGVFGVYLPWMFGRDWLTGLYTIFWVLFVSSFWTINLIADSFAGERERHTLETLLASRLSNQAILLGKYAATLLYVCAQLWLDLMLAVITINLVHGEAGQFLFYRPSVLLGAVGASVLGSGLVAGLGILISLRAATVRQAQQTLLIPITLVLLVPSLLTLVLPADQQQQLFTWLGAADVTTLLLGIMAVLLVVDGLILWAALARFQRAQLILD